MRPRGLLLGMVVIGLGAVGAALVSQHVFDMQPCPWCTLQRLVFVLIALAALVGLLLHRAGGALFALVLALAGAGVALYQHFVAAQSQSCNLTLADRILSGLSLDALLPSVFSPQASCADAAVDLLGVPYEFWSLMLFGLLAAMALAVLRSRR